MSPAILVRQLAVRSTARRVRDTLSFSKQVENHSGAIRLCICHDNLEKVKALPV